MTLREMALLSSSVNFFCTYSGRFLLLFILGVIAAIGKSENGGSKALQNIDILQQHYTASHPTNLDLNLHRYEILRSRTS